MAVEVKHQDYLFSEQYMLPKAKARKAERRKVGDWVYGKIKEDPRIKSTYNSLQPIAAPLWSYNPLHDMESIFWICLFYVLYRDVYCDPPLSDPQGALLESREDREQRLRAQYAFGRTLFAARDGRTPVMTSNDLLPRRLSAYPLHPAITPFACLLESLREILVERFRAVERSDEPITNKCADDVYGVFIQEFRTALLHLQNIGCDVQVRSLQREIELLDQRLDSFASSSKRALSREEHESDTDSHVSKATRTLLGRSPRRSPQPATSTVLPIATLYTATAEAATTATSTISPPARVLRSHTRKLVKIDASPALQTALPSERTPTRARGVNTIGRRRQNKPTKGKEVEIPDGEGSRRRQTKPTKGKEVEKATTEGAANTKTKPRKGR